MNINKKKWMSLLVLITLTLEIFNPIIVFAGGEDDIWKAFLNYNPATYSFKGFTNFATSEHSYEDYQLYNYNVEDLNLSFNVERNQKYNIEIYALRDQDLLTDKNLVKKLTEERKKYSITENIQDPDDKSNYFTLLVPRDAAEKFKEKNLGEFLGYIVDNKGNVQKNVSFDGYSGEEPKHVYKSFLPEAFKMHNVIWSKGKVAKAKTNQGPKIQETEIKEDMPLLEKVDTQNETNTQDKIKEGEEDGYSTGKKLNKYPGLGSGIDIPNENISADSEKEHDMEPIKEEDKGELEEEDPFNSNYETTGSEYDEYIDALENSLGNTYELTDNNEFEIDEIKFPADMGYPEGETQYGYYPCVIVLQPLGTNGKLDGDWTEIYMTFAGLKINPEAPIEQLGHDKLDLKGIIHKVDPINMINGNFTYSYTDLELISTDNLKFTRYYNSQDVFNDVGLGRGWRHEYLYTLDEKDYSTTVQLPDGEKINFALTIDNITKEKYFKSAEGCEYSLIKTSGIYSLIRNDGYTINFTSDNKVKNIVLHGRTLYEFEYSGDNLSSIKSEGVFLNFEYDNEHISKVTDSANRSMSLKYDQGYLISAENPDNDSIFYEYKGKVDSRKYLASASDFKGTKYLENTYDEYGAVTSQTVEGMGVYTIEYDRKNNKNTLTYPSDKRVEYYYSTEEGRITEVKEYDPELVNTVSFNKGNIKESIDKLGNKTKYEYDNEWRLIKTIYPDLTEKSYKYENGLLSEEIFPPDADNTITTIKYQYDNHGNLISYKDQRDNTIKYKYDGKGNMTEMTDRHGRTTYYAYDAMGNVIEVKDSEGNITKNEYDKTGRLIKTTSPENLTTQYEYTAAGKLIKIIDNAGNSQEFEVDNNGCNLSQSDFKGEKQYINYNSMSEPIEITDFNGNTTVYEYNNTFGLVSSVKDPEGGVTVYTYDNTGRLSSVTDSMGNETSYTYDAEGQIKDIINPYKKKFTYHYDRMGRVSSYSDERGTEYSHSLEYDKLGRLIKETDMDGGKIEYKLDGNGNIIEEKNQRGIVTKYEYDNENRLIKTIDANSNSQVYQYDSLGRLISTQDEEGRISKILYDSDDRIKAEIQETENGPHKTLYDYDNLGRVSLVKYEDGGTLEYQYDENSRIVKTVEKISDQELKVYEYSYDKNGNVTFIKDPLGGTTEHFYNGNNTLTKTIDALGGICEFGYDKNNNIIMEKDPEGYITRYSYDYLNRLSGITDSNNNTTAYTYDEVGNIIEVLNPDGGTITYKYDK